MVDYRLLWDSAHAAWMDEANRLEAENAQLWAERTAAIAIASSVDFREGHIRDNADPDQLRTYLYGAGLLIAEKEEDLARLRAALMGMARRLAAASECLGRAAERGAIDQGSFQG